MMLSLKTVFHLVQLSTTQPSTGLNFKQIVLSWDCTSTEQLVLAATNLISGTQQQGNAELALKELLMTQVEDCVSLAQQATFSIIALSNVLPQAQALALALQLPQIKLLIGLIGINPVVTLAITLTEHHVFNVTPPISGTQLLDNAEDVLMDISMIQ